MLVQNTGKILDLTKKLSSAALFRRPIVSTADKSSCIIASIIMDQRPEKISKDTLAPFMFLLILQLPRWVFLCMLWVVNVGFIGIQFNVHKIT